MGYVPRAGNKMHEAMQLRQARAGDAAAIRQLTRDAYAKWVPVIGREPKPMTVDYEAAVLKHRFDLLYLDGALAGLIETVDEADHLLVESVAVSPRFQGRGLGRRLMALAEEIAISLGRNRIRLYTNKRFERNLGLYLGLGYGVDGEEEIDGGMFRVDMSKDLSAGPG
jgi:ribosomal protein S18 acetylase RimI-like enzyme